MFERALHSAGWSSLVARRAHNPKVVGSNPAPATKCYSRSEVSYSGLFLFVFRVFLIGCSWLDESLYFPISQKKEHEEYSCSCEVKLDKRHALNKNQERYYLELYANF